MFHFFNVGSSCFFFQDIVSIEHCEDDLHSRIINLRIRKPGVFRYLPPVKIRKFINSDQPKGKTWDTENFFACILKVMPIGSGKFKCFSLVKYLQ